MLTTSRPNNSHVSSQPSLFALNSTSLLILESSNEARNASEFLTQGGHCGSEVSKLVISFAATFRNVASLHQAYLLNSIAAVSYFSKLIGFSQNYLKHIEEFINSLELLRESSIMEEYAADQSEIISNMKAFRKIWYLAESFLLSHSTDTAWSMVKWLCNVEESSAVTNIQALENELFLSTSNKFEIQPSFYSVIRHYLLRGQVSDAIRVLSNHSRFKSPADIAVRDLVQVLTLYPVFSKASTFVESSVPTRIVRHTFINEWLHFHSECERKLKHIRKYELIDPELLNIWSIIVGDSNVLDNISESWSQRLCVALLYQEPTMNLKKMKELYELYSKKYRVGSKQELDVESEVKAVFSQNLAAVIKRFSLMDESLPVLSSLLHFTHLFFCGEKLKDADLFQVYGSECSVQRLISFQYSDLSRHLAVLPNYWEILLIYYEARIGCDNFEGIIHTIIESSVSSSERECENHMQWCLTHGFSKEFHSLCISRAMHWHTKNNIPMCTLWLVRCKNTARLTRILAETGLSLAKAAIIALEQDSQNIQEGLIWGTSEVGQEVMHALEVAEGVLASVKTFADMECSKLSELHEIKFLEHFTSAILLLIQDDDQMNDSQLPLSYCKIRTQAMKKFDAALCESPTSFLVPYLLKIALYQLQASNKAASEFNKISAFDIEQTYRISNYLHLVENSFRANDLSCSSYLLNYGSTLSDLRIELVDCSCRSFIRCEKEIRLEPCKLKEKEEKLRDRPAFSLSTNELFGSCI